MNEISHTSLFAIWLFILVPVFISYRQSLKLEKDIIWSSLRGFAQLLVLGYCISYLFSLEKWYVIIGYVLLMVAVASFNVSRRGNDRKRTFFLVFFSMIVSVGVPIMLWLICRIIPFQARYIIPVAGMFSGTAMVAASVVLETMKQDNRDNIKQYAVKIAMIPTIDSLKTMGLVQIPGTMTGMILAGAEPIAAVKYQIFIVFTLLVVAAISSITVCFLNYQVFFQTNVRQGVDLRHSLDNDAHG
ncbi:ABC transporter permease [Parageobacillus thermoglucosidasius]|uniref:ABC transporter permease n=1 Tax=Parageobacillus thermoglucosidasius TaxID=1426 RepID=UPI000E16BC76|nr:ABC transporter permease [Parageobacillus thermoglucosidasius]RDE23512.1 ABC transporter permease [Parageobacillus thermoglucosidasius]RDE31266.1 ABC transporter permease [Parageobacillus thermoglucosidasius]GMN98908.1 iron export ABC transporter permease subunit FetB [Parageobacillus thermoglucosidasius]